MLPYLGQRLRLQWYRIAHPEAVAQGNPFRQIWVDAATITQGLPRNSLQQGNHLAPLRYGMFCKKRAIGMVEGGDWDQRTRPYIPQTRLLFQALSGRWHRETSWEETEFYRSVMERVEAGTEAWNGCRQPADILKRCRRADNLIERVRREGFRITGIPVVVCIGSDGSLIKLGNGQHRIMLGIITGQRIPVLPVVRHRSWEARRSNRSEQRADLAGHPDLLT